MNCVTPCKSTHALLKLTNLGYGVDDDLQALGLDVRKMGQPLSDRLKGDWKVITF